MEAFTHRHVIFLIFIRTNFSVVGTDRAPVTPLGRAVVIVVRALGVGDQYLIARFSPRCVGERLGLVTLVTLESGQAVERLDLFDRQPPEGRAVGVKGWLVEHRLARELGESSNDSSPLTPYYCPIYRHRWASGTTRERERNVPGFVLVAAAPNRLSRAKEVAYINKKP